MQPILHGYVLGMANCYLNWRDITSAGINTSKEYAELEWPFDIAITLVWVCFGIVFFWHDCKTAHQRNLYFKLVLWRFDYRNCDVAYR